MNLTKKDIVKQLREKHSYTEKAASAVVDDFVDIIQQNMAEGNTVSIRGFGTFDIIKRAARSCPSPVTRETVVIPAHWVPKFQPSKMLKNLVKLGMADVE